MESSPNSKLTERNCNAYYTPAHSLPLSNSCIALFSLHCGSEYRDNGCLQFKEMHVVREYFSCKMPWLFGPGTRCNRHEK